MDTPFPKNKIKILYVITQDEWGGAQYYAYTLAVNYGRICDVTVVTGSPAIKGGLSEHILSNKKTEPAILKNVTYAQLNHLRRAISPWHDWMAVSELKKLIIDLKPDIVHLNSSKASIIGSWAVKGIPKEIKPKVVYTVHGWVFNEPMSKIKKAFYTWLEKSTAKYKDAIIVLSEADKIAGENLGLGEKQTTILHGIKSIETNRTPQDSREFLCKFLGEDPAISGTITGTWFGTIANVYKTKGVDNLIRAIAQEKNILSKITFYIIGEGPELKKTIDLRNKLKLKNIIFTGFIPSARSFLPAFDAFVLPSRKEGSPYTILEALDAKIPIIATRVGGIPSLIENKKSGLLVKPDSVEELAEALVFAAENPDIMKQYAQNATPPPPLSEMVNKTTSLYHSLYSLP